MSKKIPLADEMGLKGLHTAPSQVLGSIRLVPLIRKAPKDDLRIATRVYEDPLAIVDLGYATYVSTYVPHALVVGWTDDGSPVASFGTALAGASDGQPISKKLRGVQLLHRMVKRKHGENELRLLPQHLAFEGFLANHFNGPEIAWSEYSHRALSRGLSPRSETSLSGRSIPALEDALRMFEIHDNQCGVLLFVGELLAAVFVVSHPDDYRRLHRTVLEDGYCELLLYAAKWNGPSPFISARFDEKRIHSLDDIRRAVQREAGSFHVATTQGLLGRPITSEQVYRAGPFSLQRFQTNLHPSDGNHIGEMIVRNDGTLEYAKTYRLSAGQTRRAYLLKMLAAHQWNLDVTARALRMATADLMVRLDRAGFGYLFAPGVLEAATKRKK